MKRLAVIDGMSVFYRGYYAMPNLATAEGIPTGGVMGFASIAIEIIKKIQPDYVAIAWDIRGTSTAKRLEIFPEYKAGRIKPPDDFYAQLPILREVLEAFDWPLYELENYEADDIMGTFALEANAADVEMCVVTGDYDLLQLISPKTSVYITKTGGSDLTQYDAAAFEKKYGIQVEQFVDYKALVGDKSDNIPGVRMIGDKAAQALLNEYGSLESIYEHIDDITPSRQKYLLEGKDNAFMSQKLARIFTDVPIKINWEETDIAHTNVDKILAVLHKYEFKSLIARLPDHMKIGDKIIDIEEEKKEIPGLEKVAWPDTLQIDGPVLISLDDDTVWLSTDRKTVATEKVEKIDKSVWRALEMAIVVSYDIKDIYHQLAKHDVSVHFHDIHDIRQAAFLIDPLRRDRSPESLIGVSEPVPEVLLAGLWSVYDQQVAAFEKEEKVARIAHEFDFPLTYTLFRIERKGVLINPKTLEKMSEELGVEHARLEQEMYSMVGHEFNIGSPAQLSEVLFAELNLPTAGIKRGKTGFSTGQAELDKLRGKHPIIELIEQTRELAKLKSTYTDALPKEADEHNRIHTTFNQDVAATGRLSSTAPNLQNIPIRSDLGKKIREAFVADKGKVLVSADYSQFELRLAAVLANDTELINDFNGDVDIHTKTASRVYGIPMEEVTKNQRRAAKVINFGVLYGMSPHGLAANTGMTFGEAKDFIDQYFDLRKPIRKFIDGTLAKARTEGYVETYHGRRRPTPDIHSSNFMVRAGAERAAANMPIQGTEADLMKLAMLQVDEQIGELGEQILQVHDSILVECLEENAEKISEILKSVMENIAPDLGIKLKVDVSVGKNWGDL
ncbi:MAG: DNA polymerase I [Candidatus Microsaccharimonas sp.]